ncbi:UNVERIFIED_CONTAM: hypothetical protein FKN15_060293 [Acipenser sinensis]
MQGAFEHRGPGTPRAQKHRGSEAQRHRGHRGTAGTDAGVSYHRGCLSTEALEHRRRRSTDAPREPRALKAPMQEASKHREHRERQGTEPPKHRGTERQALRAP